MTKSTRSARCLIPCNGNFECSEPPTPLRVFVVGANGNAVCILQGFAVFPNIAKEALRDAQTWLLARTACLLKGARQLVRRSPGTEYRKRKRWQTHPADLHFADRPLEQREQRIVELRVVLPPCACLGELGGLPAHAGELLHEFQNGLALAQRRNSLLTLLQRPGSKDRQGREDRLCHRSNGTPLDAARRPRPPALTEPLEKLHA